MLWRILKYNVLEQGGPDPSTLKQIWSMLQQLGSTSRSGAQWSTLDGWPLLPVTDGRLIRMKYRKLVFAPPVLSPTGPQSPAQSPSQRASQGPAEPVATEASAAAALPSDVPAELGSEPEQPEAPSPERGHLIVGDLQQQYPKPWSWLLPALDTWGLPVLDPRFGIVCNDVCTQVEAGSISLVRKLALNAASASTPFKVLI